MSVGGGGEGRSRLMFNEQRLCSLTQHRRGEKEVRNAYTPICHVALVRQVLSDIARLRACVI